MDGYQSYVISLQCGSDDREILLLIILYQISEDAAHSGKTDYVNLKNIVWHKCVAKIFESLLEYSKTGYWVTCGDKRRRHLFPVILIKSADYEEQ